jgi:hypothetical protein
LTGRLENAVQKLVAAVIYSWEKMVKCVVVQVTEKCEREIMSNRVWHGIGKYGVVGGGLDLMLSEIKNGPWLENKNTKRKSTMRTSCRNK